jgi:hypothetical protein
LPYKAANIHAMMRAKLNEDPRPPREILPGIDPALEEIILRAIERSPRERYASAKEMLADLEDPSQVVPRDRSGRGPQPLLQRIRVPSRIILPTVLVLVIGSLLALTVLTSRAPPRRGEHAPPARGTQDGH